jgi:beta-lactamase superfamily II metal-dependent hydrolase
VKGKALWPADISAVSKASNDDSLVMRIQDGAESFLLPGDIEKHVEMSRWKSRRPWRLIF